MGPSQKTKSEGPIALFSAPLLALALAIGCADATHAGQPPSAPMSAPTSPAGTPEAIPPPAHGELRQLPPVTTDNKSALLLAVGPELVVTASSSFPGWPTSNATDGNLETSWYSASNDSAAKGKSPFIQLAFPEPSPVRRVTILGNRDPAFLRGYTILSGRVDLIDADGNVTATKTTYGTGNLRDFDFRWPKSIPNVKIVRFTSVSDEGDKNSYGDIAIAELQVE